MLQRVQVAHTPENKFGEYLSSRAATHRYTKPQRDLVRYIFSTHNHFDADQLSRDVHEAGLNVSRATVYRTLSKLVDADMLRKLRFGPREIYEHDYGYPQHEHLYCQNCGKVIEFVSPQLETVYRDACRQYSFQADSHSLVVRGTCADCNKARVTKRRLDLI